MTLLVDTSVWSLALRRDVASRAPELLYLQTALAGHDLVVTTGLVLQELLQGFVGAKDQDRIIETFRAFTHIAPNFDDHVQAAMLRNTCRRAGVQLGTIDALIAQLCIRHGLVLLTTDKDFTHASAYCKLKVWAAT